ncbi:chemotaxis protein CheW [Sulfoacidibacillus thermotolerans]|uniref:CheW-like domain-containing protein n=1 Tax=Sulfoacidibacillus thermotolerans TaxID=1765684 RepID=A0A2U3D6H8_SULT2|nr:chemotaxis protein CheW [Sulfoacidibacillus thermotolerans]PWI56886.1 hypothetical protein BM613_11220 [Sulfoacidibacillus thermotolerans]
MKVVIYRVGQNQYATPVESIQSIERMLPIRPVPGAAAHVLGVANLRGSVIAVSDLRKVLNVEEQAFTPESRLLISNGNGYVVDEALDIADCADDAWEHVGEQKVWQRGDQLIVWEDLQA